MARIKYLLVRILKMDYKQLFQTVRVCKKRSGKNSVWLFFDIIRCGFKYGAGHSDYRLCAFYDLTPAQRATYVTRGVNNRLVRLLNDKEACAQLEDKTRFNRMFEAQLGRGWLDLSECPYEDFAAFMQPRGVIIAKPVSATCGVGVRKLRKSDYADLRAMYDSLREAGSTLVEDYIVQHEALSKLYPHSVNTLRIVTVLAEGRPNVVYSYIRLGNGGRVVDNINAGGMTAPVDLETGEIKYAAFDKDSVYYETHPETGEKISGFKIPFWKESLALCEEAAAKVPGVGYVGWDVAVTGSGPVLIEANHFPGHDFLQMPPHVPDKIGMLPRFREFVKGI